MPDISFYHLTRSTPEAALFQLLDKAYKAGHRSIVRVGEEDLMGQFDTALWTLKTDSFLPHGTTASKDPKAEPILLTAGVENLNKAEFAFVMAGASVAGLDYFDRVFLIFDGASDGQVKEARKNWKDFTAGGLNPTYWTQEESGRWAKKEG